MCCGVPGRTVTWGEIVGNASLLAPIKAFVAEFTGVSESELNADTKINADLGVDGDDALEFMTAFEGRFQVDLSGFVFRKYFGPEGWNPTALLTPKRPDPLTLGQLAEAAEAKVWSPGTLLGP